MVLTDYNIYASDEIVEDILCNVQQGCCLAVQAQTATCSRVRQSSDMKLGVARKVCMLPATPPCKTDAGRCYH